MSTLDIVAGVQLSEEVRERKNKIQGKLLCILFYTVSFHKVILTDTAFFPHTQAFHIHTCIFLHHKKYQSCSLFVSGPLLPASCVQLQSAVTLIITHKAPQHPVLHGLVLQAEEKLIPHCPTEMQVSAGHWEQHLIIWPLGSTRSSQGLEQ